MKFNEKVEEILEGRMDEGNYKKVRLAIGGSKLMGYESDPKYDKSKLPSGVKYFSSLDAEDIAKDVIALGDKKMLNALKKIYKSNAMDDNTLSPIFLSFYADYYERLNDFTKKSMGRSWKNSSLGQVVFKIGKSKGWY